MKKHQPSNALILIIFTFFILLGWYAFCRPDHSNVNMPISESAQVLSITLQVSSRDQNQNLNALRMGNKIHLKAMAKYSDGGVANISDKVLWTSSQPIVAKIDSHGVLRARHHGQSEITVSYNNIARSSILVNVLEAQLIRINVQQATKEMPNSLNKNSRRQLVAIGTYDDDQQQDLTDQVHWMLTKPSNVAVVDEGLVFTQKPAKVSVTAEIEQLVSAPFTLNFVETLDSQCATPTIDLTNQGKKLRFHCPTISTAIIKTLSHATKFAVERGTHGPAGMKVARLKWSDANQYCSSLGNNYRLPTKDELLALYAKYPVDTNGFAKLYTLFGWPVNILFWSSTPYNDDKQHYFVGLYNGGFYNYNNNSRLYVSCIEDITVNH